MGKRNAAHNCSSPKSKNKLSCNCFESKSSFSSSLFLAFTYSFSFIVRVRAVCGAQNAVCNKHSDENELCVRNLYLAFVFLRFSFSLSSYRVFTQQFFELVASIHVHSLSRYIAFFFTNLTQHTAYSKRNLWARVGLSIRQYAFKWLALARQ